MQGCRYPCTHLHVSWPTPACTLSCVSTYMSTCKPVLETTRGSGHACLHALLAHMDMCKHVYAYVCLHVLCPAPRTSMCVPRYVATYLANHVPMCMGVHVFIRVFACTSALMLHTCLNVHWSMYVRTYLHVYLHTTYACLHSADHTPTRTSTCMLLGTHPPIGPKRSSSARS